MASALKIFLKAVRTIDLETLVDDRISFPQILVQNISNRWPPGLFAFPRPLLNELVENLPPVRLESRDIAPESISMRLQDLWRKLSGRLHSCRSHRREERVEHC